MGKIHRRERRHPRFTGRVTRSPAPRFSASRASARSRRQLVDVHPRKGRVERRILGLFDSCPTSPGAFTTPGSTDASPTLTFRPLARQRYAGTLTVRRRLRIGEGPQPRIGELRSGGDRRAHSPRVAALAGAGELLVSRTVKDLVAGSGYAFVSRGLHRLKGVPDEWEILAVQAGPSV